MSFVAVAIGGAGLIGSIGGGLIASSGANKAATTQAGSADYAANLQSQDANKALDFNKLQYSNQQQELNPYLQSGYGALANLNYLLGMPNSSTPLYSPGAPTTTSTGTPNAIPYEGNPNVPQYIPGPHGSDMPNPAYGAQQRSTYSANLPGSAPPGGSTQNLQTLQSLVNPNLGAPGSLSQGWTGSFQSPTDVTEQNDPGYKFRLAQGQAAIQNSAAARGGALTEGAAKDLNDWTQGQASNEYGNVYNRAYNNYTTGYNQFEQSQTNLYNRLAAISGTGQITAQQLGQGGQAAANTNANTLLTSGAQIGADVQNAGSARATGYLNSGNIMGNAFNSSTNNLANLYSLHQMMGGGGTNLGTQGAQDIGNQDFGVV